ncbi:MAG: GAF domain-containing protein, partial [Bacteroidota bacterium]
LSVFFYPRKFITRVLAGIILLSFVLLYIQILNGLPELRFFIFTTFTILIVYQDWRALWPTALFLFVQIAAFIYLGSSFDFINAEYKALILRLVSEDPLGVEFYIGIACFQVALAGLWAHFLRQQTISEVITKESLLLKQIQIEEANTRLEENVKAKTRELQEALELSQSGEEELRQNMEELKATQEEMEYQKHMLLENQEKMQKVEQELRERQSKMERSQWLESNLSRFDDIMRLNYDKEIEVFADMIMLNLAELLQATQGAFYIFDEVEDGLSMIGGYACTPQTVKKSKFKAGEGVLGQILKTKKRVYLEEVPVDSAVIESALTQVKSKSILIEPLMYNSDIQGVIEIGLLNEAKDLHLEFMQRLARNIASMLQSIRGILRTQRLLKQSQEITSQLQSNARELEKTKQEVEEKALEFKSQFKAIDRSMLVIECTTDGDVLRANENFLHLSEYAPSELERKHHSIFLSEEFSQSDSYQSLWQSVQLDEYANSEFKCRSKNGNEFWIKAYYYSLGVGAKKKVMILAYDTTL